MLFRSYIDITGVVATGHTNLEIEDATEAQGLNIHWLVGDMNDERHRRAGGGDKYDVMIASTPATQLSAPIVTSSFPSQSGLTQDKVFSLCSNTLLNSSLVEQCRKYFNEDDISFALDFCMKGKIGRAHV